MFDHLQACADDVQVYRWHGDATFASLLEAMHHKRGIGEPDGVNGAPSLSTEKTGKVSISTFVEHAECREMFGRAVETVQARRTLQAWSTIVR